ncbi:MAG: hypothetical protein HDS60_03080 [Barnesiella sp.]|nr:hypothetical protein [Bacteroidales bacterium]MBD5243054.1 hypothetical protein [Barnesiella sp.]
MILKTAISEGIESGIAEDFDPDTYLKALKASRNNGKISFVKQAIRRPEQMELRSKWFTESAPIDRVPEA